jgi:NAD(P)-dependent dehydrogenase (short-subunit alcohol dehydrogenase family)
MQQPTDPPQEPLAGRVAIVTGAAQGIGLGIATALLERGATVFLADVDEDRLAAAPASLGPLAARSQTVVADVADGAQVARLVREAEAVHGSVDILVNNAGVLVAKTLVEHSEEDWDRVCGVNLRGPFLCMRAALPGMIAAGRGSIVSMSSIAAFHTTTEHASYAASKAALAALTRDVASEVAEHGVRVNAIAPGPIETPMTRRVVEDEAAGKVPAVPLGRMGMPADIAAAVAFLVSDEASFVTGVTMAVAGGADLRLRI